MSGVSPSGQHYYPAFPYPHFTKMTRDDVFAIRAYLATLTPINNATPPRAQALADIFTPDYPGVQTLQVSARTGFLVRHAQRAEDLRLHVLAMDTDRA